MKNGIKKLVTFILLAAMVVSAFSGMALAEEPAEEVKTITMLRLYNPNSGEHFYTGSEKERDDLVAVGWQYEGQAWAAPTNYGEPVYRMFNPNAGDHHYTMSAEERDWLVDLGWKYEGVAWNSLSTGISEYGIPHYRLYNPNADAGSHHYTASVKELNDLVNLGWRYEGISFYGYAVNHAHEHEYSVEADWTVDTNPDGCKVYACKCGLRYFRHEGMWIQTKAPTQSTAGVKERMCQNCGVKETAEIPAGEYDVFSGDPIYFVNANEYDRLYSINPDGSGLQLVLDEKCIELRYSDGRVLYRTANDELIVYDTITHEVTELSDNYSYDFDCHLDGQHAYYWEYSDDGQNHLYHHNLKTGEKSIITPHQGGDIQTYSISGGYGRLYFVESVYLRDDCEYLYAYDPETKQCTLIDSFSSLDELVAVDGGVVYEKTDREGLEPSFQYCYTTADGSETRIIEDHIPDMSTILYADENGVVYEYGDSICYLSVNGEETRIASSDDGWLSFNNVGGERFWLKYIQHDTFCSSYHLFDADFFSQTHTLIPLDTKDKLANMFADGDFPLIDSSTARKPLTGMLYNLFVERQGHRGTEPVCSTTHGAWLNIADRKVDLAFLAAPTEEEQAYLYEKEVQVDMKLYGGDGLVFIGNAANPVTNLTHEQIIDIYTGKITNWSEVGGPDEQIFVYYRDPQSGSQRLFEKIVFKGLEPPNYEELGFHLEEFMSTIVADVAYEPYSIGYTIMTYLGDVHSDKDVKTFSINGVEPSSQTVADSSYPYGTKGYIVIRSDELEDSPARRLYDWFGCKVSDEILINNDITPLHETE